MEGSSGLRAGTSKHGIAYIACGPQNSKLGVICVHGWGCQATDYTYLFTELLKEDITFRAIAVNLPGHGSSKTAPCPVPSMSTFADATLRLVNELEIPELVLVGHSMGVRVILEGWKQAQAAGKPTVKGIVFLDGSHYKFRISLLAGESNDTGGSSLSQEEKAEKLAEAFKNMFSVRTPVDFQESTLAHVRSLDPKYGTDWRQSHVRYDYEQMDGVLEELGQSGTPVLNLSATYVDDANRRIPVKPGEMSRWMILLHEMIPHAQQFVVEDSLHFPHVDQPAEVARRMLDFLEKINQDSGSRSP